MTTPMSAERFSDRFRFYRDQPQQQAGVQQLYAAIDSSDQSTAILCEQAPWAVTFSEQPPQPSAPAGGLDPRGGDIGAACADRCADGARAFNAGDVDIDAAALNDSNLANCRSADQARDRHSLLSDKRDLSNLPGASGSNSRNGVVALGLDLADGASSGNPGDTDRDVLANNGNANLPKHWGQGRALSAPRRFTKASFTPAEELVGRKNRGRLTPSALSPFATSPAGDARHGSDP